MQKTVIEIYEANRKRLLKNSKKNQPLQCDVLGVVRTIFPNISFENSISDIIKSEPKEK